MTIYDDNNIDKQNNNWGEWSNKVLGDLKELNKHIRDVDNLIVNLRIELAIIKTKSALIGMIASIITSALLGSLFFFIFKSIG